MVVTAGQPLLCQDALGSCGQDTLPQHSSGEHSTAHILGATEKLPWLGTFFL